MAHWLWGEFQSLTQLSIALNAAFATIPTFLGNSIKREQSLVNSYISDAEYLEELVDKKVISYSLPNRRLSAQFSDISAEYRKLEHRFDQFIYTVIRYLCLIAAAISFVILIISSCRYNSHIPIHWRIYSILQYSPFIAGISYAFYLTAVPFRKYHKDQLNLYAELQKMDKQRQDSRRASRNPLPTKPTEEIKNA
jgi:hypothetical protein